MMTLAQIARVMGGRLKNADAGLIARGVSTDTRSLRKGQLFVALNGPRHDGHKYIEQAFEKGACAVVAQVELQRHVPVILLDDTLKALGDLAAAYRLAIGVKVVAITGTNGKTTTKEMIAHVLGEDRPTVKAPLSYNNAVGVPLTLLAADEQTEFVVVEAGTNAPGEMSRLGEISRPDVAVITNVSEGHLAGLKSPEGVAKEKGALLNWMRSGGTAVLNADNPWTAAIARSNGRHIVTFGIHARCAFRARAVHSRGAWASFVVDDVPFKVRSSGLCNVSNAMATVAVARTLGIDLETISTRLIHFKPPPMRMESMKVGGVTFVNDAYNANPASMRAAVAAFARMRSEGRRVAVLGDMKELGLNAARLHQEVARFAAALELDTVLTVGTEMGRAAEFFEGRTQWASFRDAEEAAPFLRAIAQPGDLILLKASRAIGLESILDYFRNGTAWSESSSTKASSAGSPPEERCPPS